MVSWDLIKNPYNWLVVVTMLLLGTALLHLFAEPLGLTK